MKKLRLSPAAALVVAGVLVAARLPAGDGRLEINQACAAVGCFSGDSAGFPVTISTAGSYVLTSNLSVTADLTKGIQITADRMTLDLNGFSLVGPDTSSASNGISIEADEVEIRNGMVRDFFHGISFLTQDVHAERSRVVAVKSISNHAVGIQLGPDSVVVDCTVVGNGGGGINLRERGVVRGSVISGNGTDTGDRAVVTQDYGLVQGNVIHGNTGDGVRVGEGTAVIGNVIAENGGDGIHLNDLGALVRDNSSTRNTNWGIATVSTMNSLIIGNVVNGNRPSLGGDEIEACATCLLVDNHAP